jgi:hypothetical protein
MIYHYIFTPPVRDGTCWSVYVDQDARLEGLRRNCFNCRLALTHTTCAGRYESVEGLSMVFGISGNYTHSGILQTCNTVLSEALPISLASMHISLFSPYDYVQRALKVFLANMHQRKGAYLSNFTCKYYKTSSDDERHLGRFSELINRTGIKIGHLVLCDITNSAYFDIGKRFIATLDRLEHKPASVVWTPRSSAVPTSSQYERQRCEFNKAAGIWLAELAKVKAAGRDARLPLLRDFLPQYFEESSSD